MIVNRWRRYGKDRLDVVAADGVNVGWVDLLTGSSTIDQVEQEPAMWEAVNAWLTEHPDVTVPNGDLGPRSAESMVGPDARSVVASKRRGDRRLQPAPGRRVDALRCHALLPWPSRGRRIDLTTTAG